MTIAAIRAAFPVLSRAGFHYLDNAAMAQCPGTVVKAVAAHDLTARANVHRGLHELARRADEAYDGARERVAAFLSAGADEVVFTGGCTLALNIVALALEERMQAGDRIVVSAAEHHSNLLPWLAMARRKGLDVAVIPVNRDGRLDLSDLSMIDRRCKVVAVTHASNVTGAVTDIPRLAGAAHAVGAVLAVDGAQRLPHGPVDPRELGADFYAFAGHKTYGPTGIGVLWGRREALETLPPALWGGGMVAGLDGDVPIPLDPPARFEAGTPPVAQAVGLARALDWMAGLDWPAVRAHEAALTRRLLDGLAGRDGIRLVGPADLADRLPVVSFAVEGCHPHDLSHLLAERGVAVRGGAHCARPLMSALGLDEGCVRASLAPYNDETDVDALLSGLDHAIGVLR
ncbi:aminotransferase class V-fold PLP-dependent enzyme [Magnetospirillum sp. SS-4]|uniref:aminotransferase class V-fold PLP-dependent enzyme n=1 Tax=Magnetospirillum sp. SS-4 TaxID=2681465 RepID=UPI00137C9E66|nr:aminotransferase class V-fold PLP-dependent enzyme [Magnetospirillum sp. SS-4]CAA7625196.1 putative cysteine desulfurase [Magnetospirillum sp. SS-4]